MTAFVPGFEHDLFISYAHDDDERWIEAFTEALCGELTQKMGTPVCAWQDTSRLRAGENWQVAIQEGIERSAAFVAVVSPTYQNSTWCARERNEFRNRFTPEEFAICGRFFKAVKMPWAGNAHHHFLKAIQNVDFFEDSHGPVELKPGSKKFERAVRKLADGVQALLRRMRRANQRVHVAWPVDECLTAWRQLNAELSSKGFDVQPTGPRDASFAEELLMEDMDHAVLSVHLLGSVYDQFAERIALLAANQDHQMMFWMSSGAETTADAKQMALVNAIKSGVRPDDPKREWPQGWSLIADAGIRKFIDAVVTRLRPQPQQAPVAAAADTPTIYIVHDATTAEDTKVALDLKEQIGQHEKMQVFVSRADLSSPTELKLWHENLLRSCDGVLLYRNAAPEGWWNQLAPEIILAERRFERQPIKSRAFLLPRPPSWEVGPDVKVIPYQAPFEFAKLEPFLDPLRH